MASKEFASLPEEEKIKAFKEGAMGFINKKDINYFVITLQIKAWLRLAELERQVAAEEMV